MGRALAFELLLLGGVALLAWRLRREIRLNSATLLFLPLVIAAVIVMERDLSAGATGPVAPLAALVGLLGGLVVVRATWVGLLAWPGALSLPLLGWRGLLWAEPPGLAERGWRYYAYRHAIAPARRRLR